MSSCNTLPVSRSPNLSLQQTSNAATTRGESKTYFSPMNPPNALHHDIFNKEKTSKHLKAEVDLNICSISGRGTPLHILIANEKEQRFFEVIEELKHFPNIKFDYTTQDGEGKTLLILACKIRKPKIVKAILENSNNKLFINMIDKDGRTALHYAAALGDLASAMLLLNANAFPLIMDNSFRTPYQYTEINEDEINKILESIQIDPRRHFKATCNSMANLEGGKIGVLPTELMHAMKLIPSKFKLHAVEKLSNSTGISGEEILICQENEKAFDYNPPSLKHENIDLKTKKELHDTMHKFQKALKNEWERIKGVNLSFAENCLKGHAQVRKLLSKFPTANFAKGEKIEIKSELIYSYFFAGVKPENEFFSQIEELD